MPAGDATFPGAPQGGERYRAFDDFDDALLRHTLTNIAASNADYFEAPDPVGFRDYLASAEDLIADLRRAPPVDPVYLFPCNDAGKLRQLSVLSCPDLVRYSAAAAKIARTTNSLLPRDVFATRLEDGPPTWSVFDPTQRWPKFRGRALSLLGTGACAALQIEDVASFFQLVSIEILTDVLRSNHCDRRAVNLVRRMLAGWAGSSDLRGLPIGSDASRLLGTALLLPVDRAVEPFGDVHHLRWMDDNYYLGPNLGVCGEATGAASEALLKLGLGYSAKKSSTFDDADAAIAHLEERAIASVRVFERAFAGTEFHDAFIARVESLFEELDAMPPAERRARPFRFALNRFAEDNNRFAVPLLASNPDLANVDPLTAGKHLLAVGPITGSARDDLLDQLADRRGGSDRYDALDLQILRVLSDPTAGKLGADEGRLFEGIAANTKRRAPVRAWAVKALGASEAWTTTKGADIAEAEQDEHVRRAALIPFRGRPSVRRKRLLGHMLAKHRELKYTARWVEAA